MRQWLTDDVRKTDLRSNIETGMRDFLKRGGKVKKVAAGKADDLDGVKAHQMREKEKVMGNQSSHQSSSSSS
jgi:hypothetical protein